MLFAYNELLSCVDNCSVWWPTWQTASGCSYSSHNKFAQRRKFIQCSLRCKHLLKKWRETVKIKQSAACEKMRFWFVCYLIFLNLIHLLFKKQKTNTFKIPILWVHCKNQKKERRKKTTQLSKSFSGNIGKIFKTYLIFRYHFILFRHRIFFLHY